MRAIIWMVLGMAACSSSGSPDALVAADGPVASIDASPPDAPPPDAFVSCIPGASAADCLKCPYPTTCARACPAVDCSGWPLPAECVDVCADPQRSCCRCMFDTWVGDFGPVCGTRCTGLRQDWNALVRTDAMVACGVDADCTAVGGSGTFDCAPSIGDCGRAVNRAAYGASTAAADLVRTYFAECTPPNICDCTPPVVQCVDHRCTVTGF